MTVVDISTRGSSAGCSLVTVAGPCVPRPPRTSWDGNVKPQVGTSRQGRRLGVKPDANGQLWAQEKLEASGYSAIRVDLAPDSPRGPLAGHVDAILDRFTALGITGSGACSGSP